MTNVSNAIEQLETAKRALRREEYITSALLDAIRQALMVILYDALMYDGKVSYENVKKLVKDIASCLSDIDFIYAHFHNLTDVDEYLSWDITHIVKAIDSIRKEMEVFI